jgi:hypothetical protein
VLLPHFIRECVPLAISLKSSPMLPDMKVLSKILQDAELYLSPPNFVSGY